MTDPIAIVVEAADKVENKLPGQSAHGFTVAEHLDDRTKELLLELAKNVI